VAQTNQYPDESGSKILSSGHVYKYRTTKLTNGFEIEGSIQIYNSDSKFLDVEWNYRNGKQMSEGEALGYYRDPYYFSYRSFTTDQLRKIVSFFINAEKFPFIAGSQSDPAIPSGFFTKIPPPAASPLSWKRPSLAGRGEARGRKKNFKIAGRIS
jgi:hypothetical protein